MTRKLITTLALCVFIGCFAQKNVAKKVDNLIKENTLFRQVSLLEATGNAKSAERQSVVKNATYAKINKAALTVAMGRKDEAIELEIPYGNGTVLLQLYRANLFTNGFRIGTDKVSDTGYRPGVYYRGIVKGDPNSVASISLFDGGMEGLVSSSSLRNLVIGKLRDASGDYIIYSDAQLNVRNNFMCEVTGKAEKKAPGTGTVQNIQSDKCVTMYFELRNNIYEFFGQDITATGDWMTGLFNNIQTLYENDGVSIALNSVYIWTSEDIYSGPDSYSFLSQFVDGRCTFAADLGQLIGFDVFAGGGVAHLDQLCGDHNYSYCEVDPFYDDVPLYSWNTSSTTHEIGHNLGSPHTQACYWNGNNTTIDGCYSAEGDCDDGPIPAEGGTIMSYCHLNAVGTNLANGFGPQPRALILDRISAAPCLSTDCTGCYNTVCSIEASNITDTTAQIEWTDENQAAASWQFSVQPLGSPAVWTTVNTNSYNAAGLLPNTYYNVMLKQICGAIETKTVETSFITGADYCNGIVITDTGGISGQYESNQNVVRTIIPNQPNKKIKLTFTEFAMEEDYDYVGVFDGNSTGAPLLGWYTGYENPGEFESSAADGSLTIWFTSDDLINDDGYAATVACMDALGTNDISNIDFTYYPNPVKGVVTIASKTPVSGLSVYSTTGQLLQSRKVNATDISVDLSGYAEGTYVFKLDFNGKSTSFKIQKK